MEKVLCVGEALIDMICTDKGSSLSEGLHFLKKTGGAPTNVAAAVAALGGFVDIMACVGSDPFGVQLIKEMESFGVGTSLMKKDLRHFTTMAFVSLMENGERDFVFSRGADGHLMKEDFPDFSLQHYGILHLGSATAFLGGSLHKTYFDLLNEARTNGLFVSFDPNYRHLLFSGEKDLFSENSWKCIHQADFFKVSDEEAKLLTKCDELDDAIHSLKINTSSVFAVTLGSQGTALRYQDDILLIPSIQVPEVQDTTGAGDAFVGAVLSQLSQFTLQDMKNLDRDAWCKIVKNGNIAGAKTCEYMGAMEAFKQLSRDIFNM